MGGKCQTGYQKRGSEQLERGGTLNAKAQCAPGREWLGGNSGRYLLHLFCCTILQQIARRFTSIARYEHHNQVPMHLLHPCLTSPQIQQRPTHQVTLYTSHPRTALVAREILQVEVAGGHPSAYACRPLTWFTASALAATLALPSCRPRFNELESIRSSPSIRTNRGI